MSARDNERAAAAEALEYLREYFKPGDTVYTVRTHTSQSGMSRRIMVLARTDDGIYNVSHLVARTGMFKRSRSRDESTVTVGGAGFDAGFEIAYRLGRALFQTDDYVDARGGRDAGYALSHRAL